LGDISTELTRRKVFIVGALGEILDLWFGALRFLDRLRRLVEPHPSPLRRRQIAGPARRRIAHRDQRGHVKCATCCAAVVGALASRPRVTELSIPHVIVPNRQARADGALVSIDSKSLFHEAKAAGIIYQATLRHELHAELGLEWAPVDPVTGMAEIAAAPKESIKAWSQRSSRLREWAHHNLVVVDGAPIAQQLAAAQKATRPAKPESTSWAELKEQWRADARGVHLDRAAPRLLTDRARLARLRPRTAGSCRIISG
jgi:hypothetical protein